MPKRKPSIPDAISVLPLQLTELQRGSLISGTQLQPKLKSLLKKIPKGTHVIELTKQQLEHLDEELPTAARYVRHPDKGRIVAVHKKVNSLLEGLLDSADAVGLQRQRPADESNLLFQFKIVLRDITPAIWRRIQIEDGTLAELHDDIQIAMGWDNDHLHQFDIDGERYGPVDDEFGIDDDLQDEQDMRISQLLPKSARRTRWLYEYDFGDGWEHEILFEGYPEKQNGQTYPVCLEGKRACPPEDIGGPWGYAEFLEAISDPKHERHDEFMDWVGEFDPELFDAGEATVALRAGGADRWNDEWELEFDSEDE